MTVNPVISEIVAAHIEGMNAKEGSREQTAAFRRRDALARTLTDHERGWMQSVCRSCARLVTAPDGAIFGGRYRVKGGASPHGRFSEAAAYVN